ncbi:MULTISPECIES: DeoR/GlpR family DNA-binding transcription regulator [unclassified Streptomyces]|uniref:DeoR/GlpR family DNA-binding transcription regulator n=1 Tax=unclassified Streptomyces TaxID=2593676 RepID=UPI00020E52D0|nr:MULTISPECIES: DeoR/GlpR family DNA-binding transcription regulator [unclassified Streptomyces]ASY31839.1 DeoR family transcriptional regulator [Streptomyces sp. CLI2509]EGJ73457.1 putative DeoR family transcriptional regulator [Streptomyces sp. Tu6071]MYR30044.1 DeoR family transcriptional regulator [Streptomyces sp. SID4945]MYX18521.1 DeoR family transcriptional regulator [Streptomyces sp. SID8380]SCD66141.1 transcriptional regulator, DeoR family [Streptomyces sp. TverLS-915]
MAEEAAPSLIPDQRRELLVRHLRREGVLSVQQITQLFGVSHMTVRRDIAELERQGLVFSVPGGVRIASPVQTEPSYQTKTAVEQPQKQAMAARAAELVQDGMTVYLDAGTTLSAMVPLLARRESLTVVTNDFTTADLLMASPHIDVIHVGGRVEPANRSSVGRLAARTLRQLALDLAFVSTSSWDRLRGVTTPSELKVEVKKAAMECAGSSVLVAGSSKYGTFGKYRVAPLTSFDVVITDEDLAEAAAEGIRAGGTELLLARPEESLPQASAGLPRKVADRQ